MTPTFAKLKVFLCCTICTASVALLLASYNHLERNEMISEHYSTSPYRIAFDGSLESSLERARGLTSESVQSHALAMIAETEVFLRVFQCRIQCSSFVFRNEENRSYYLLRRK